MYGCPLAGQDDKRFRYKIRKCSKRIWGDSTSSGLGVAVTSWLKRNSWLRQKLHSCLKLGDLVFNFVGSIFVSFPSFLSFLFQFPAYSWILEKRVLRSLFISLFMLMAWYIVGSQPTFCILDVLFVFLMPAWISALSVELPRSWTDWVAFWSWKKELEMRQAWRSFSLKPWCFFIYGLKRTVISFLPWVGIKFGLRWFIVSYYFLGYGYLKVRHENNYLFIRKETSDLIPVFQFLLKITENILCISLEMFVFVLLESIAV